MESCVEYFSRNLLEGSRGSAREIVPVLLRLLQPKSAVDVGCGVGSWLAVLKEFGVEDIFGIDGDWADRKMLEIPEECFLALDLRKPFQLDRCFDLVLSLEVAQHLPGECAEGFVDSLTKLGPFILFSAAIPFQGGIGHLNEQWPDYWVAYFAQRGYLVIDCIRRHIWNNGNVEWWFAQNTFLFATRDAVASRPLLRKEWENTHSTQLALVHPRKYLQATEWIDRLYQTVADVRAVIAPADTLILVGGDELEAMVAGGRRALPFLVGDEQEGDIPPDDSSAIRELERLLRSGASFLVFAWPAVWWLDCYALFHRFLHSEVRCVLQNDRVIIFDLHPHETGRSGRG
jgi:SAM-dependent methyltransferase